SRIARRGKELLRHVAGGLGSAASGAARRVWTWRRRRSATSDVAGQQVSGDEERSVGADVLNRSYDAGDGTAPGGYVSISSGSSRYKADRIQLTSDVKVAAAVALTVWSVMLPWMYRALKCDAAKKPSPGAVEGTKKDQQGSPAVTASASSLSLPPPPPLVAPPPALPSEYPRVR
ncbi:hypothetical protein Vafri_5353, partial [Volvox africanus]